MFENNRILIVDDNESIHDDFRKILLSSKTTEENEYKNLELELFGNTNNATLVSTSLDYQIDFVFQGEQALELVERAERQNKPYALIFMDVRMPPGWDGIETISKIWERFPNIEIVICSAYSDYSWDKIISKLGTNDRLLFLKKPFDAVEVQQMALALVKKWNLAEKSRHYVDDLEREVAKRTKQLKSMVQELINSRDKLKQEIFIRRQAEQALASEKENLVVTLRSIRDAVITIDIDGTITLVNKVAEDLLGVDIKGLIGKPLRQVLRLVNANTKERLNVCPDHTLQEGKIIESDDDKNILITRDQKEVLISLNCSQIIDKNNKISGIVVVIRDVSEKQKFEEELLKAKKLDSVSTFAGGIAHDFNNILTGIIGNITMARLEINETEKVLKCLDSAEQASLRASKLAQQLLSFSIGGPPVKELVYLQEIIADLVYFVSVGSDINYKIDVKNDLIPVSIDREQISQVFNNLILNAINSTDGSGTISISAENARITANSHIPLKEGTYLKISISDEGCGIPKEYIENVFDPYFTTKEEGNGLGLATVYSIIKKHDGYITVDSEVDKGCTFTFYLPGSYKAAVREKQILVVDEEEMIRNVLNKILEELGYKVVLAENAAKAIKIYKKAAREENSFSAVIMDFKAINPLDYHETLDKLREIDPDLKAIISSSYTSDPVIARYKDYGFKGVITKPFRVNELRDLLDQIIDPAGGSL
jgi:two-component system cell cycle sensor histidine kinase/response regulator CckA